MWHQATFFPHCGRIVDWRVEVVVVHDYIGVDLTGLGWPGKMARIWLECTARMIRR